MDGLEHTELDMFRNMLRIRRVEEALAGRYGEQLMRCPMHLCIGQEASAVGVCQALETVDQVWSGHRAHGHYLAKGGGLRAMIAELHGRTTGCAGGRGGSMHLVDKKAGFMGSTAIVGGTVPLGVGAAWSAKLLGENRVSVVFFGDGCFEEGVVHESMNFSAVHSLPVVFVCENNRYAVFTSLADRQPKRPIVEVAAAHGLQTYAVDGADVQCVYDAALRAVSAARAGQGPQFIEVAVSRWLEHCGPSDDSHLGYRPAGELERQKKDCPLDRERLRLERAKLLTAEGVAFMEATISSEIGEAFEYALGSPFPDSGDLTRQVYA